MTLDDRRWQTVNAYVDGELDPAAAAELAAAVARDRELAAAVALVTQLKAATAESAAAPVLSLPTPRRWPGWRALAASAALLCVLGGALAVYAWRPGTPDPLAGVIDRHLAWAGDESAAGEAVPLGPTLAGLLQLGLVADVPDLADAGLHLAQVSVVEDGGAPIGIQARYIGTRGCRITLFVERGIPGREAAPRAARSLQAVAWAVRDVRYTLLASGMYEQRFATIAAAAEAATRRDAPAVETLRQALRDQREHSPPCLG